MKNFSSSIAGAVILLTITTILSRAIGFLREIIFAGTFGFNREFEIYLVAAVLPILINTAINYLAQNYFIPAYNALKTEEERIDYTKTQFWIFILLGLLLSLLFFALKGAILGFYLGTSDPSVMQLASGIFSIYIISFPVNSGYSILTAYLQAELKFRHPAISQVILNLPIIIFVLFFSDSLMIYAIPAGYLTGSILQLIYLYFIAGPGLLRINLFKSGKNLRKGLNWSLTIIIFIEVINQLHPFIDRYFYSEVQPGGVAALNYASVLFSLPVTIFSFALASVVFPLLSKSFNSADPLRTNYYYEKSLTIIAAIFIPVMLIFIYDGDLIVTLVFQRGKFNTNDSYMTYGVLKMYSFSLVFYAGYAIINKMIFSSGLLKPLLLVSVAVIAIKITLNFIMVRLYQQEGLALTSAFNFIILSAAGYYMVVKHTGLGKRGVFFRQIFLFLLTGLLAYFISWTLMELMELSKVAESILEILMFALIYTVSIWYLADNLDFRFK